MPAPTPAPPARRLARCPACRAASALALAAGLVASPAAADPPPPRLLPAPDPITAEVGVRLGGAYRLGEAPAFGIVSRGGALAGAGIAVAPSSRFAIGVAYEHEGLGIEHGSGDLGGVDLRRAIDGVWASVRLTLFRADRFAIALLLGPGLVWQSESADVVVFPAGATPGSAYACSGTAGPGLGLRAGLGGEVRLGRRLFFTLDAVVDELRLSGDAIGACAPGAGSTAVFGVRGGVSYRLDVSRYVR